MPAKIDIIVIVIVHVMVNNGGILSKGFVFSPEILPKSLTK